MSYLKTLMLIVLVAISNVSASTGLEEQMNGMTITPDWVSRAKAILPQITCSDELRVEIQSMIATLDSNPSNVISTMVIWFSGFDDAELDTEGDHFKAAIRKIFNPAVS